MSKTVTLEEIRRDFDMGNKALWERAPEYIEFLLQATDAAHAAGYAEAKEQAVGECGMVAGACLALANHPGAKACGDAAQRIRAMEPKTP